MVEEQSFKIDAVPWTPGTSIFITGATGFIGNALLERLILRDAFQAICLVRNPGKVPDLFRAHRAFRFATGDVHDSSSYALELRGVDTVIHLASATGAADPAQMEATNVQGTADLLASCRESGVRRFIFVSSIAVTYPETETYPYASSKRRAEALVRNSGLEYVILRPTIVLGGGSPNWDMLRKIANLPFVPLIGGGAARVQPVDVRDVAAGIEALVTTGCCTGSIIELGGPEELTFEQLLRRIRKACGRPRFLGVPIPVWPLRYLLRAATVVAGSRMPVTAGQLTPFVTDGLATPSPISALLGGSMLPLDELLAKICAAPLPLARNEENRIRECRTFTRYLVGSWPDDYVTRKYVESAHLLENMEERQMPIDEVLVSFGAQNHLYARIADAYARVFRPRGLLRRKVVLVLALLECSRGFHRQVTSGGGGGILSALIRVALAITAYGIALSVGTMLFGLRDALSRRRLSP